MAKESMVPPTPSPKKPLTQAKRDRRWWLIAFVVLLLLSLVAVVGWRQYRQVRQRNMVARAENLIKAKDYGQAILTLRRAVQLNPNDVKACGMMADLAELAGFEESISWRRVVSELEPASTEKRLAWAETALRFNEAAQAEQALAGLDVEGRKTAAFHHISGRIAEIFNDSQGAEAHFLDAAKLDPKNERYRLDLASIRLASSEPGVRTEARAIVENLATKPELQRSALRSLLADAVREKDLSKSLSLANTLQSAPEALFQDRILYLGILRQLQRPEFHTYLLDLQERSLAAPENAAALLAWMNRNSLAMVAVDWSKSFAEEIRIHPIVAPAIAEAYANLKNWPALLERVAEANWKELDYMRLALHARALREAGDNLRSTTQWNAAIQSAAGRPEALARLTQFAQSSKWDAEATDLLWTVAKGRTNQQWALSALLKKYLSDRNARALLDVSTRMAELKPEDRTVRNNVASLSFLLNENMERAQILAREVYEGDKSNPGFSATYAYSLHLQGKTEEGIKVMRALSPELLQNSSYAAYLGVLLAEDGAPGEAENYLHLAKREQIFPEEYELVKKAREKLARRSVLPKAPEQQ